MAHLLKEIEYKGFKILAEKATDKGVFYTVKGDAVMSKIYLYSEKAAMNVIDTYLKSLK